MKSYYRVTLGRGNKYVLDCLEGNFIGADFDITEDISPWLLDEQAFRKHYIAMLLAAQPERNRASVGGAISSLWKISKGVAEGDIVLCPDGAGNFRVCQVTGGYYYVPSPVLPHRRPVRWFPNTLNKATLPIDVVNSIGAMGTIRNISHHAEKLDAVLQLAPLPEEGQVEDAVTFAMEKYLEEFLVSNWEMTELGKKYSIYEVDENYGQQFPTDTGPIDILAISKDKKTFLVIELKRGRASDVVVGQTLRYMGYVQEELAEEGQEVRGLIIALEDCQKLRRALSVAKSIDYYRYQVDFKMVKG